MRAVFLDRQDTRHVSECYIILVLEPRSQEVQILLLGGRILLIFAKQAVPFVDQDDERTPCFRVNVFHHLNEVVFITEAHLLKRFEQVERNVLLEHCQHFLYAVRHA